MSLEDRFGHKQLSEYESKKVLEENGIAVVEEDLAESAEEARKLVEKFGIPAVMKVESRDIQHKTDAGGVNIVRDPNKAEEKYREIIESVKEYKEGAEIEGVLVEEFLEGNQFIAGINTDPQFGKVLMFGLGGIYVEVFRDLAFRVIPVEEYDVETMIEELESRPLLEGVRGQEKADMEQLKSTLRNVSELAEKHPEIKELDINPLFINGSTIKAADALITLDERK
ncbi:MAG: acetate--CoA ligase family protein [Candidatus Nanohaloarchaea archaeon]|nr:acetate--CoA ligase family protein [Candidatus Nanohaloarchaea archaeon]